MNAAATSAVAIALVLVPHVALARTFAVSEVQDPQADHRGWVTDHADILPADVEIRLEALLDAVHQDLGAEVVVVTVGDVDAPTPKDFATQLFNTWGIGDATANNGLLVLMVMDQRRIEMETGYGLETVLTDGWLGRVRTDQMVPSFKTGDFAGGIEAGMVAIDGRLREYPTEVREGTRVEIAHMAEETGPGISSEIVTYGLAGGGLGGLALVAGGGAAFAVRRRRRRCPTCKTQMRKLDEVEEDEHLDDAQELEEAIGSRQWSVYVCETCEQTRTFKRDNWFSGYSTCPQCSRRTKSTSRTTIRAATRTSGGLVRIHHSCANCSYTASFTRSTPRLPDPESSSSSGGSSFGGGSSGGGSFGGGSSGGGGGGSSW